MKINPTLETILIILVFYIIGYLLAFCFGFLSLWMFSVVVSDLFVVICLCVSIFTAVPMTIMLMVILNNYIEVINITEVD